MTEEELREKIADILTCYDITGLRFEWRDSVGREPEAVADKILALFREAGWKPPEYWNEKWDASEHYKD